GHRAEERPSGFSGDTNGFRGDLVLRLLELLLCDLASDRQRQQPQDVEHYRTVDFGHAPAGQMAEGKAWVGKAPRADPVRLGDAELREARPKAPVVEQRNFDGAVRG